MSRLDLAKTDPTAYRAMVGLDRYLRDSDLDRAVWGLIKVRVSLINGCAYCLAVHTEEALRAGESERRLGALTSWPTETCFTDSERAALELADTVTRLGEHAVPDGTWDAATRHWSDSEIAQILLAIVAINGWNRIAIATRMTTRAQTGAGHGARS